jgi:hypothetical protein
MKNLIKNKQARRRKMWAKYRKRIRILITKPEKTYCYKSGNPDNKDSEKFSIKHKKSLIDE